MLHNFIGAMAGDDGSKGSGKKVKCDQGGCRKIKGRLVLMKKNVLDFNDLPAKFLDDIHEWLGQRVSLQLVGAVHGDPSGWFFSTYLI